MKRATVIDNDSNKTKLNLFTPTSDLSETHPISMDLNRRLVKEIIDNIFDEQKGQVDISSSQCSSSKLVSSEYSYDKRLKYWKDTLEDRQRLGKKIQRKIDKKPEEILFNRHSTLDDRNKRTVQRLIDYANRMEPLKLVNIQAQRLKEKFTRETCLPIPEVIETLPQPERNKCTIMEISGLPDIIKKELLGKPRHQGKEKPYSWLKSQVLERHIEEISDNIERVIEYYPDIDNLQIVGESIFPNELKEHSSDIKVLSKLDITTISTDSSSACHQQQQQQEQEDIGVDKSEYVELGLRINDIVLLKRADKNINIDVCFTALPFQRKCKLALTIKNIGQKMLTFDWCHSSYYHKCSTLLKPLDNEFCFDQNRFRLNKGEVKEIVVMYQPRRMDAVKDKWFLKVQPQFFWRKTHGIVLKLTGICYGPPEYNKKLDDLMRCLINKSNTKMMQDLTTHLASLAPLIESSCACPYQRTLNQMELFEQLNDGFKCERYHDIELLKQLYERVRKRRQCPWDLKLDSLKCAILALPDATKRALYINELMSIIEPMRGKSKQLEMRILENSENERTKLLFVRSNICANIDEWEELTIAIEESFLKTYLVKFIAEVEAYNYNKELNAGEEDAENHSVKYPPLDDEEKVRQYALNKRIRHLKSFRDCLYMQTYTFLCNCAENLVFIIDSTDIF